MLSVGDLPGVGALRAQIMAPAHKMLAADRLPQEQYAEPLGDPGLFGPDSVTWRVHADPSMLVGGIAALLLQTLHPLAMAGVAEHSDYRQDPLGRLSRTASFVTATTYGATPVAESMIAAVKRIHTRINGIAPDGRPYTAEHPELLCWVHMAEMANFLRAHQRFVPFPVRGEQADRYYDETAVIAERLGATNVPRSCAEADAYFQSMRPKLAVGEQALDALRFITTPPLRSLNPAIAMAQRVVIQAAIDLLPRWGLEMLRLRRAPSLLDWTVVRPAAHLLLQTMRVAGGRPPPLTEARRRCAA